MYESELEHFGIKGMKWGKRKSDYHSTSVRSALAKKQRQKVDRSFKNWKEKKKKQKKKKQMNQEELMRTISPIKNLKVSISLTINLIKKLLEKILHIVKDRLRKKSDQTFRENI